jgi:hypothetical protein
MKAFFCFHATSLETMLACLRLYPSGIYLARCRGVFDLLEREWRYTNHPDKQGCWEFEGKLNEMRYEISQQGGNYGH